MKDTFAKLIPSRLKSDTTIIPVIRLHGTIAPGQSGFRPNLNLANVAGPIEKAFSIKKAPAVAISVNSPGGSPVQSRLIYQRIRDLAEENDKEVFVFVEDVAASGGYMIAIAGDEIIADPSSIIGSIGVVAAMFGFSEMIKKIGVERRVYTAGENKVTLDPFQPEKQKDVDHLKSLQLEIHEIFKDLVKSRRGEKLADADDLFSGQFWTGGTAKQLGLIDELGDLRGILRKRYGENVKLKLIGQSRGLFGRRLFGGQIEPDFAARAGAGATAQMVDTLEQQALYSRYGLSG